MIDSETKEFSWIPFYTELAPKLLKYKDNRSALLEMIYSKLDDEETKILHDADARMNDIDPFTIYGMFNRGTKDESRQALLSKFKEMFGVSADIPEDFEGIPCLNAMKSHFFGFAKDREEHDIDNLWNLFAAVLNNSDNPYCKEVEDIFNVVRNQYCIRFNITMGLFWILPYKFLSLDERNQAYMISFGLKRVNSLPEFSEYVKIINAVKQLADDGIIEAKSIPEFSVKAYTHKINNAKSKSKEEEGIRYWLYTPGENASQWEKCLKEGIMCLGWNKMGNFLNYKTEKDVFEKLSIEYGKQNAYNDKCAVMEFAHKIKPGDVIFAKKGRNTIIGRGIVESDYFYDDKSDSYKNLRKVNWTDQGTYEHPGKAVTKTLTDITKYSDYVDKLNALFAENGVCKEESVNDIEKTEYTDDDFLAKVFLNKDELDSLKGLIDKKKNVILQGAPGVGKTFAARRLAYVMMGEENEERVEFIQFHQNYTYEDFIMGYKPNEKGGFELQEGIFYKFCRKAQKDSDRKYFFIIDEINRGNLSKIFGELLMLIENGYRGKDYSIKLAYRDEKFYVPENLYIIGMMNTADRSLAMIDYALRRRFSFFEMRPAFESNGFKRYQESLNSEEFDKVIKAIIELNKTIEGDDSLGAGFCIGHSYFCNKKRYEKQWMKNVIMYDIKPMLEEYWFDDKKTCDAKIDILNNLLNDD